MTAPLNTKRIEMYNPLINTDTQKEEPIILGIESSCDETAAAVIKGNKILSDEIASSADIQALYGGVVPEIASRAHTDAIAKVVEKAVQNAGIAYEDIDAVAVTYGAGCKKVPFYPCLFQESHS